MYQNNPYRRPVKVKKMTTPKGLFLVMLVITILIVVGAGLFVMQNKKDNAPAKQDTSQRAPSFDKKKFSLTDPTSPWVVVNKLRPLSPKTYEPADLRTPSMQVESSDMQVNSQTATALEALSTAAESEGIELIVASAYRSHDEQVTIYNSMVRGYGQDEADRQSARPGYSEHQTGWAADLGAASGKCRIEACFADTKEGKWLAASAYKYGFIIRYAEGKESITGYEYEPWHVRYVGIELATEMYNKHIQTLEEFFGLGSASTY